MAILPPGHRVVSSGRPPVAFACAPVATNPVAAASAGADRRRPNYDSRFLASGAIAGAAGAIEVTGVTFALYDNISPGYGYTAIAVALLASLDPLGSSSSGILFGALEAGAAGMQRDAGVPAVVATLVEAVIVLLVLAAQAERPRGRAPAVTATAENDLRGVRDAFSRGHDPHGDAPASSLGSARRWPSRRE